MIQGKSRGVRALSPASVLGLAVLTGLVGLAALAGPVSAADLVLQGRVLDDAGLGIGGVEIHAYVDGFEKSTAISGGDGGYTLTFSYDPGADQTMVVWWAPGQKDQVPELLILKESEKAQEIHLWSRCIPRLELQPSLSYDVTIHTEQTKFELLGQSDCMGQDVVAGNGQVPQKP